MTSENIIRRNYKKQNSEDFFEGIGGGPTQYLECSIALKCPVRCLTPVKNTIWIGSGDGTISIRKAKDGSVLRQLRHNPEKFKSPRRIFCNTMKKQFHTVWTGGSDGILRGWTTMGDLKFERRGHKGGIKSIAANDSKIWSWSDDYKLVERNQTGRVVREVHHKSQWVRDMITVEDYLWTASEDCILVWARGKMVAVLTGHNGTVLSLLYHADKVWSGGTDGSICLWDWKELSLLRKINCGNMWVSKLIGLKDVIFSASPESHFCIWDAATGNLIKILHPSSQAEDSSDLSSDGWVLKETSKLEKMGQQSTGKLVDMAISEDGNHLWLGYRHPPCVQIFRLLMEQEPPYPVKRAPGPLIEISMFDETRTIDRFKREEAEMKLMKRNLNRHSGKVTKELKAVQEKMEEFKKELKHENSRLQHTKKSLIKEKRTLAETYEMERLSKSLLEQENRSLSEVVAKREKEMQDALEELNELRKERGESKSKIEVLKQSLEKVLNKCENLQADRVNLQATLERERVELKENYAHELNGIQEKFSKAEGLVSSFNQEEEKYVRQINVQMNAIECLQREVTLLEKKLKEKEINRTNYKKKKRDEIMLYEGKAESMQMEVVDLQKQLEESRAYTSELEERLSVTEKDFDDSRVALAQREEEQRLFNYMLESIVDQCSQYLPPYNGKQTGDTLAEKHALVLEWVMHSHRYYENHMEEFKQQIDSAGSEKKEVNGRVSSLEHEIERLVSEKVQLQAKVKELESFQIQAETMVEEVRDFQQPLEQRIHMLQDQHKKDHEETQRAWNENDDLQRCLADSEEDISRLERERDQFKIQVQDADNMRKEIQGYDQALGSVQHTVGTLRDQLEAMSNECKTLRERADRDSQLNETLLATVDVQNETIHKFETETSNFIDQFKHLSTLQSLFTNGGDSESVKSSGQVENVINSLIHFVQEDKVQRQPTEEEQEELLRKEQMVSELNQNLMSLAEVLPAVGTLEQELTEMQEKYESAVDEKIILDKEYARKTIQHNQEIVSLSEKFVAKTNAPEI